MTDKKKKTSNLSNVHVQRVGLVGVGANQEEFFLLKGDEEMEDPTVLEELEKLEEEAPPEGLNPNAWQRLLNILNRSEVEKAQLSDKAKAAVATALRALAKIPPDEKPAELLRAYKMMLRMHGGYGAYGEGYPEPAKKSDEEEKEVKKPDVEIVKEELPPELVNRLTTLEKANEDLRTAVVKAQEEAETERKTRRRQELVVKARDSLIALSVKPEEVAEIQMFLEQQGEAGTKWRDWLDGVLKAADHGLVEAGLFSEKGTTNEAEVDFRERVNKAAKDANIPFADAVLTAFSPEEQLKFVRERRQAGGK